MQGIYTVTVFVDSLNCQSNATTNVLLDPTLGMDHQAAESDLSRAFSVIPNPASDQIIVSFLSAEEAKTIKIYDMNGRLVSSSWIQVSNSKYLLSIHDLPSGLYQVAVQTWKGTYFNRFAKLD
jgi:flagellar hook assembly protein FlgD